MLKFLVPDQINVSLVADRKFTNIKEAKTRSPIVFYEADIYADPTKEKYKSKLKQKYSEDGFYIFIMKNSKTYSYMIVSMIDVILT